MEPPWDMLCKCCELSMLAYKEPDEVGVEYDAFYDGRPNGGEDAEAYMWWEQGNSTVFIAFRGTESRSDVLADLDVRRARIRGRVRVHNGFHRQLHSVIGGIESDIRARLPERVVVCGHSLGGALATLAAAHLADLRVAPDVRCYVFGCPRVGNRAFVRWFTGVVTEHWRVNNTDDPVPKIPISLRFKHVPCHVDFSDCGKHAVKHGDRPFLLRVLNLDIFGGIAKDHGCNVYRDRLQALNRAKEV